MTGKARRDKGLMRRRTGKPLVAILGEETLVVGRGREGLCCHRGGQAGHGRGHHGLPFAGEKARVTAMAGRLSVVFAGKKALTALNDKAFVISVGGEASIAMAGNDHRVKGSYVAAIDGETPAVALSHDRRHGRGGLSCTTKNMESCREEGISAVVAWRGGSCPDPPSQVKYLVKAS